MPDGGKGGGQRFACSFIADRLQGAGTCLSHDDTLHGLGVEMAEADVLDALDTAWADEEAVCSFADGEKPDELHALCGRFVTSYLSEMAPR